MRNRRHFITLGIFVIFSTMAMIIIGLWLSVGITNKTYYTYLSIFHEPVDGLSINSNVLYNGVNVGKVQSIELDKTNPGNIHVSLSIIAGTPVTKKTYAILQQQGITGLSYVSLQTPKDTDDKSIELLEPTKSPPYPTINSKPSFLTSLTDKFQEISNSINEVTTKVNDLLNTENTKYISSILKNTDAISENLKKSSLESTRLITSAANITTSFEKNNQTIDNIIDNVNTATEQFDKTSKQLTSLTNTIEEQTIPNINGVLLPQMSSALSEIHYTALNLNQLIEQLQQNPSMLIKGKTPVKPGPGE